MFFRFIAFSMIARISTPAITCRIIPIPPLSDTPPNTQAELTVISACVLGGVSLSGGIGMIRHVIAGVLILAIIENAMNLKNIDTFYQYVIRGSILLLAVVIDRLKQ